MWIKPGSANAAVDILVGEDSDVDMYKCNINALYKCKELLLLLLSVINIADLCHKHTHALTRCTGFNYPFTHKQHHTRHFAYENKE